MKKYSIAELLEMDLAGLPKTKMGLSQKADREKWPFEEVKAKGGRGGVKKLYTPPPEILKQVQAVKLNWALADTGVEIAAAPAAMPLPVTVSDLPASPAAAVPAVSDGLSAAAASWLSSTATEAQRNCEAARMAVLREVEKLMADTGMGKEAVITSLLVQAKTEEQPRLANMFRLACDKRGGSGGLPSVRTVKRWFTQRERNTLLPQISSPADGRVPVFRKGDMIVIGNRLKQDIGSAFTAGQTITLERQNLDRLCLIDAQRKHVTADRYTADLAAGTLTFADPLDLSAYAMPLTAVQAWEEENRIARADISGRLKLQFPVSRDYPQQGTYVSSALIGGDLLVRASEPFSQQAWGKRWKDEIDGDEILARLDVRNYPFQLTSDGAVTQRWLIQFTSDTQFELYGETLGLVAKGDTLTDLAPANPATGKPYFTLPRLAFGGGWAARNCIRFNTYGTPLPVWILRAVQPSPERQSRRDGFTACLRGNTVAED